MKDRAGNGSYRGCHSIIITESVYKNEYASLCLVGLNSHRWQSDRAYAYERLCFVTVFVIVSLINCRRMLN